MTRETAGIIMSAAYISSELQAEFGRIPPAFLPVGARRLYSWQIKQLRKTCEKVYLTLPESYTPAPRDIAYIQQLGAEIQPIPDGISIGHSLLYALNILSLGNTKLKVLHGDTLIRNIGEFGGNALSVHETNTAYTWATIGKKSESNDLFKDIAIQASSEGQHQVLSGHFSFSEPSQLIRALTQEDGNYLAALSRYHASHPLTPVSSGSWMDFGHMQTYQNSKKVMTTERAFNTLQIHENTVTKYSENSFKMEAEANWLDGAPSPLRLYTPPFLGRATKGKMQGYTIGYQPLTPLNDLLVFGELGRPAWDVIMAACSEFLSSCKASYDPKKDINPAGISELLLGKTLARLQSFEHEGVVSTTAEIEVNGVKFPSLVEMAHTSFAVLAKDDRPYRSIMHGDFCFSNILYDSRSAKVCVIDPRGYIRDNELSLYGDIRYDIAKLYHSAVGKYDFIISDYAKSSQIAPQKFAFELDEAQFGAMAESAFLGRKFAGIDPNSAEITAITVHLFLSMLPLHNDDKSRQLSLMLNATRLYAKIFPAFSAP